MADSPHTCGSYRGWPCIACGWEATASGSWECPDHPNWLACLRRGCPRLHGVIQGDVPLGAERHERIRQALYPYLGDDLLDRVTSEVEAVT